METLESANQTITFRERVSLGLQNGKNIFQGEMKNRQQDNIRKWQH